MLTREVMGRDDVPGENNDPTVPEFEADPVLMPCASLEY